jgi:hypothetical protein
VSKTFCRNSPLVLMHVPKTGGTAITEALKECLKPKRSLSPVYDGVLFGSFTRFQEMRRELRELIYVDNQRIPSDADFVAGHVSLSTLGRKYAEAQLVTFLREPKSRLISHWLFFRGLQSEVLDGWEPFSSIIRISHDTLQRFLSNQRIASQTDNLYVRMLLWPHPLIPDDDFISSSSDNKLLEEAALKLSQFSYSDVIESPDLCCQLQAWLGMPISIRTLNVTPPLSADRKLIFRDEFSIEAVAALCARTRLDSVLWQLVASRRGGTERAKVLANFGLLQSVIRFVALN